MSQRIFPTKNHRFESPKHFDKGRKRAFYTSTATTLVFAAVSFFSLSTNGPVGLTAVMGAGAVFMSLFTLSIYRVSVAIKRGRACWRAEHRNVTMESPIELLYWEVALIIFQTCAILLLPLILQFSRRGEWMFIAAPTLITLYAFPELVGLFQNGRPSPASITLTKEGITFRKSSKSFSVIPWNRKPKLTKVRKERAVITSVRSEDILYSMSYVPLTYRQLERLLATFSTDGQLRARLSGPKALTTVLAVLEPTEEELTDGSWTWSRLPQQAAGHEGSPNYVLHGK